MKEVLELIEIAKANDMSYIYVDPLDGHTVVTLEEMGYTIDICYATGLMSIAWN